MSEEIHKYYKVEGICYPHEEVHNAITQMFAGIANEIISTSKNPKSVGRRIALLKTDPKIRARVWKAVIDFLKENSIGSPYAEVKQKYKEKLQVANIDFAKVGMA